MMALKASANQIFVFNRWDETKLITQTMCHRLPFREKKEIDVKVFSRFVFANYNNGIKINAKTFENPFGWNKNEQQIWTSLSFHK